MSITLSTAGLFGVLGLGNNIRRETPFPIKAMVPAYIQWAIFSTNLHTKLGGQCRFAFCRRFAQIRHNTKSIHPQPTIVIFLSSSATINDHCRCFEQQHHGCTYSTVPSSFILSSTRFRLNMPSPVVGGGPDEGEVYDVPAPTGDSADDDEDALPNSNSNVANEAVSFLPSMNNCHLNPMDFHSVLDENFQPHGL